MIIKCECKKYTLHRHPTEIELPYIEGIKSKYIRHHKDECKAIEKIENERQKLIYENIFRFLD